MWTIILCVLSHASSLLAQPVSCFEDAQCHEGFYCDNSVHICRECLSCKELSRTTNLPKSECIKSVADCGPCLDGLVVNHLGLECVNPSNDTGYPYYMWPIIIGSLIVIFLAVAISVCLCKGNMLKISSRTWLRQTCSSAVRASAPDAPPPYNPHAPAHYTLQQTHDTLDERDMSRPFIKRVPTSSLPDSAQETSDKQTANVWHQPIYDRTQPSPNPPLSPEPLNSPIHDENTSESDWTPTPTTANNLNGVVPVNEANASARVNGAENGSGDMSTLLAAARDTTLVEPPPKKFCAHDTNNNGNRDSTSSGSTSSVASTSHAHTVPAMFVKIQVNNTVGTAFNGQFIKTNKS